MWIVRLALRRPYTFVVSLGLGEGGEQSAALGRAVLGGLVGSTLATLFLVSVVYSVFGKRSRLPKRDPELETDAEREAHAHAIPVPGE